MLDFLSFLKPSTNQLANPASPQGGGLFGGYQNFVNSDRGQALNDMFTGWAMGSNLNESLGMGARMTAAGRDRRKHKQAENQTLQWLAQQGLAPEEAQLLASNGPALTEFLKQRMQKPDPTEALQDEKLRLEIGQLKNPTEKLTDDMREYQAAKAQGFEGTFMEYQIKMKEAGRQQVNIDTGAKLPSGYRWLDPKNQEAGVEPIPGGPGETIPGELAARVGMADSFLAQLPSIRDRVKTGEVTGPVDRALAGQGYGAGGETYRHIQSGVDVLMRLLTGAGMNQTEAEQYARRYLPTYVDNAESLAGKLDQLERELKATRGMAMRGRGGETPSAPAPANDGWSDVGNGVRIRRKQ